MVSWGCHDKPGKISFNLKPEKKWSLEAKNGLPDLFVG